MGLFHIHSLDPDDGRLAATPASENSGSSSTPMMAETTPLRQGGEPAVSTTSFEPEVSLVVAHLNALLEERNRQLEAATRRVVDAQRLLLRLADELCPAALDEVRRKTGLRVDEWPAERLVAFIVSNAKERLLQAERAIRQHSTLMQAYNTLLAEHRRLQNDFQEAVGDNLADGPHSSANAVPEQLLITAAPSPTVIDATPTDLAPPPSATIAREMQQARKVDPERVDDVVRVMAATGFVRSTQIRERLRALWGIDRRDGLINGVLEAAMAVGYVRAYPVKAEWHGAPTQFIEVTEAGMERAELLGCPVSPNEMAEGVRRKLRLELISLVLQAADVLNDHGYTEIVTFPRPVKLPDGVEYAPLLSARDRGANTLYLECEREKVLLPRDEHWLLAARVGGETVRLVTTSQAMQDALTSEINLIRVHHPFRLMAFNINEYQKGKRGPDNSIWVYNR
jgi:hypothetical protein